MLISFPYTAQGSNPAPAHEALVNQIGSTWGLAYQRSSDRLFAAAYLKRHVRMGPGGTCAIYQVPNPNDGATSGVSLFVNLANNDLYAALNCRRLGRSTTSVRGRIPLECCLLFMIFLLPRPHHHH